MLGLASGLPVLPSEETRLAFLAHYAAASSAWLALLEQQTDGWFEASTTFFDTVRPRAWVLTRRLTHSAHHRGQLTAYIRSWGDALYSTYGPTADTGGLAANGASVIYRYRDVDELLSAERTGGSGAPLITAQGRLTERA